MLDPLEEREVLDHQEQPLVRVLLKQQPAEFTHYADELHRGHAEDPREAAVPMLIEQVDRRVEHLRAVELLPERLRLRAERVDLGNSQVDLDVCRAELGRKLAVASQRILDDAVKSSARLDEPGLVGRVVKKRRQVVGHVPLRKYRRLRLLHRDGEVRAEPERTLTLAHRRRRGTHGLAGFVEAPASAPFEQKVDHAREARAALRNINYAAIGVRQLVEHRSEPEDEVRLARTRRANDRHDEALVWWARDNAQDVLLAHRALVDEAPGLRRDLAYRGRHMRRKEDRAGRRRRLPVQNPVEVSRLPASKALERLGTRMLLETSRQRHHAPPPIQRTAWKAPVPSANLTFSASPRPPSSSRTPSRRSRMNAKVSADERVPLSFAPLRSPRAA